MKEKTLNDIKNISIKISIETVENLIRNSINKDKLEILYTKSLEEANLKSEIGSLQSLITKESGEIVNIKNSFSIKNKENLVLKDKYENFRIQFEINKKHRDAETIRKEKIEEEITATQKQIKNTQNILLTLNDDIKKANYEESILLKNPNDSQQKIVALNKSIELNKIKLKETDLLIIKQKTELELISQKYQDIKIKLDTLKEDTIRKEAQLEQLNNYIKSEEDRIESDLRITKEVIKNSIDKVDYSYLDIKNSEVIL